MRTYQSIFGQFINLQTCRPAKLPNYQSIKSPIAPSTLKPLTVYQSSSLSIYRPIDLRFYSPIIYQPINQPSHFQPINISFTTQSSSLSIYRFSFLPTNLHIDVPIYHSINDYLVFAINVSTYQRINLPLAIYPSIILTTYQRIDIHIYQFINLSAYESAYRRINLPTPRPIELTTRQSISYQWTSNLPST